MTYEEFLISKIDIAEQTGFEINDDDVNPILKPHQKDAVKWAVKGGRRALFESFGLEKPIVETEDIKTEPRTAPKLPRGHKLLESMCTTTVLGKKMWYMKSVKSGTEYYDSGG